jgi:hypothetical protein
MLAAAGVVYADIGILHGAVRRGDVAGWHSERPARLSIPDSEIRAAFRLDGLQLCREFPSKAEGVCDAASPDRPGSGRRGCRAELSSMLSKGVCCETATIVAPNARMSSAASWIVRRSRLQYGHQRPVEHEHDHDRPGTQCAVRRNGVSLTVAQPEARRKVAGVDRPARTLPAAPRPAA